MLDECRCPPVTPDALPNSSLATDSNHPDRRADTQGGRAPPPLGFDISGARNFQISLFQLIQMLEPCQNDLLARLFDLAREEHLIEDCVHLVKVEDQIQLADIAEEGVEDLDKEVDGLEVG